MRIKKRLQINAVVSMMIALGICLVLSLSFYRLNKGNNTGRIAGELMISTLERVSLRNDYIRTNSARAKEQWFVKNAEIGELLNLASENFSGSEDRKNIAAMINNHESFGKFFRRSSPTG